MLFNLGDFSNTKEIRFAIQKKTIIDDGNGGEIISYNNLFLLSLTNQSQFYIDIGNGSGAGFYYSIPWSFLYNYLEITEVYNYVLAFDINGSTQTVEIECVYGGNTVEDAIYNQGQAQINNINEQTDAINNQTDVINTQTQVIQQQTEAIEDLNNSITDTNIESSASDLPSIDIIDPSQNGIDNIFQSIYNAFCVGQAQDIIFPIPFTSKNIILSPYYVRDMLNNFGGNWIYTLIQSFWGYLIGRFIVSDISKKITKIKSGNVENIENENIKEEML